jgi:hypothetical protein
MTIPTMLASKAPDLRAPGFLCAVVLRIASQPATYRTTAATIAELEHGANSGEAQELKLGLRFWVSDDFSVVPQDGVENQRESPKSNLQRQHPLPDAEIDGGDVSSDLPS